jgi:hypothetical protein
MKYHTNIDIALWQIASYSTAMEIKPKWNETFSMECVSGINNVAPKWKFSMECAIIFAK